MESNGAMTDIIDGRRMRSAFSEQPEEVLELLRAQATLYVRLEKFATNQRSLVRDEDAGPLLSLLADRQRLSTELTRVAGRLAPVRERWSAFRDRLSPAQRLEAEGLLQESSQRLRRVIESDEQDARLLGIRKQRVSQELRATHAVGEAILAYGPPRPMARAAQRLDESS